MNFVEKAYLHKCFRIGNVICREKSINKKLKTRIIDHHHKVNIILIMYCK